MIAIAEWVETFANQLHGVAGWLRGRAMQAHTDP